MQSVLTPAIPHYRCLPRTPYSFPCKPVTPPIRKQSHPVNLPNPYP